MIGVLKLRWYKRWKVSALGKVQLKIPPWIDIPLNRLGSDWFTFEEEIDEGTTIANLWGDLALNHTDLRKVVFNPDAGDISDQFNIIINNRLLQFPDVTEVKLNDGDGVILLPSD